MRLGTDQTNGKAIDYTLRVGTKGIQTSSDSHYLQFYEYNTMDEQKNVVSPASNVLEFTASDKKSYETILKTETETERFQLCNVYPDWAPDQECKQILVTSVEHNGSNLSWTTDADAKAFLIEQAGEFVAIVDGTESVLDLSSFSLQPSAKLTVRAANMMGGFGPATEEGKSATGIDGVKANGNANGNVNKVMEAGKLVIKKNGSKFNAAGQRLN